MTQINHRLTDRFGDMGLVPLVQNKRDKPPAPKIPLLTLRAGRRETPTEAVDDFPNSIFGAGPAKQAHEVCMCACATAGFEATAGWAGQYGPAAQAGEDFSPGGRCGGWESREGPPTQSQTKGHLELSSVTKSEQIWWKSESKVKHKLFP